METPPPVRTACSARAEAHVLHRPGIDVPQDRKDTVPQDVPGGRVLLIRLVLHMGDLILFGIVRQHLPGDPQKRPADIPPHLGDPGKAGGPGAPDQIQQHGLGVVVGVMGGEDGRKALPPSGLFQESIAQLPGSLLQRKVRRLHQRPGISRSGKAGDPPGGAPVFHKPLVPVRKLAPQAVIEMGGRSRKAVGPTPGIQEMQQAHGVQPAGNGAQHSSPRRKPTAQEGPGGHKFMRHSRLRFPCQRRRTVPRGIARSGPPPYSSSSYLVSSVENVV